MIELLQLNHTNRKRLQQFFAQHLRSDLSIESFFDFSMGRMFVDDVMNPQSARLVTSQTDTFGGFCRFAGRADTPSAREAVTNLPTTTFIMPSPDEWIDLAIRIHGDKIAKRERFSFSASSLNVQILEELSRTTHEQIDITAIDLGLARNLADDPENRLHFANWGSTEDFIDRGIGYCAVAHTKIVCAATSALICKSGIEMNLMTHPEFRRRGIATTVCAQLALECLRRGLSPHWDAANPASARLAQKLGYTPNGTYEGYLLQR